MHKELPWHTYYDLTIDVKLREAFVLFYKSFLGNPSTPYAEMDTYNGPRKLIGPTVMQNGDMDLGRYWLRWSLIFWRHPSTTITNVHFRQRWPLVPSMCMVSIGVVRGLVVTSFDLHGIQLLVIIDRVKTATLRKEGTTILGNMHIPLFETWK